MEGAAREAVEEANAYSDDLRLFGIFNLPRISQGHYESLKSGNNAVGLADITGRPGAGFNVNWLE